MDGAFGGCDDIASGISRQHSPPHTHGPGDGPKRILLIRHGLSTANVNPDEYKSKPDQDVGLVHPGDDATLLEAARHIKALGLDAKNTAVWYSPYLRTQQTRNTIIDHVFSKEDRSLLKMRESFLLREQEFGDWDNLTDEEKEHNDPIRFRKWQQLVRKQEEKCLFFFRYPNG